MGGCLQVLEGEGPSAQEPAATSFSIKPLKFTIPAHSSTTLQATFTPNALQPSQQQFVLQSAPAEGDWAPVTATILLRGEGAPVPVRLQAEQIDLKVLLLSVQSVM